jgi:hypothetical protein
MAAEQQAGQPDLNKMSLKERIAYFNRQKQGPGASPTDQAGSQTAPSANAATASKGPSVADRIAAMKASGNAPTAPGGGGPGGPVGGIRMAGMGGAALPGMGARPLPQRSPTSEAAQAAAAGEPFAEADANAEQAGGPVSPERSPRHGEGSQSARSAASGSRSGRRGGEAVDEQLHGETGAAQSTAEPLVEEAQTAPPAGASGRIAALRNTLNAR